MRIPLFAFVISLLTQLSPSATAGEAKPPEHPLLAGIRSPEVWNPHWPSVAHDKLLTGFSPLECGMKRAPVVLATIHPGGVASYAAFLTDEHNEPFLLVQDAVLRRIDAQGNVVWQYSGGRVAFYRQLHGDESYTLGLTSGRALVLIDPATGKPFWQHTCEGFIDHDKVRVAKLLADSPGKQIAVFPQYVTVAYLFAFSAGTREPSLVWKTEDAGVANWPQQADHGVSTIVEPDGSVIWNIRHHTLNTHDPRTGKRVRRFEFQSGGGKRRNYGPSVIGRSVDGRPLLAVIGQAVQHHLTCFTRTPSTPPSLILDKYVGEVYQSHGVTTSFPIGGLGDVDGDGGLDVVYSARFTQPSLHTRTFVCDVATGREQVLEDTWIAGVADIDGDGVKEIFAYADPHADMPSRGTLHVYRFDSAGKVALVHTHPRAQLPLRPVAPLEQPDEAAWGNATLQTPLIMHTPHGRGVLIRDLAAGEARWLLLDQGNLCSQPAPAALFDGDPLATGQLSPQGAPLVAVQSASGRLAMIAPDGTPRFELPLTGGGVPLVSATDLTGDGRAELIIRTPHRQAQVVSLDSDNRPKILYSVPFDAATPGGRLSVPARDVTGDRRPNLLGTGHTPDDHLCVRLYSADGGLAWESPLPMPGSGEISKWIVGDFFGPDRPGVFVSAQQGLAREESYMLRGADGQIVWTGLPRPTPSGTRACNPVGIPTAFDVDGDGAEDVMLDYRDFVAVHRGLDGSLIRPITPMPRVPKGWVMAYNSFTPIYRPGAVKPDFLVPLGHGGIGLLANDLKTEIWTHKPYYDTPAKIAIIDVDGDGRTEAGYEEQRNGQFVCRDLLTGAEEWRLKLDGQGYGPALSADFNSDGKGEFLIGNLCIGTDAQGRGKILWRMPVSASSWSAIADVNADGRAEIIIPGSDGQVRVLAAE